MRQYSLKPLVFSLFILITAGSCATTGLTFKDPHVYSNTFNETVEAVNEAIQLAHMKIFEARYLDNGDYFVRYFESRYDMGERNIESAFTADLTVKKLTNQTTQIHIIEEEQPDMVPGEFRKTLARDLYRQLNKLLTLAEGQE